MKLPKIGELITIKNPENGTESVGKVSSINGHKVKIVFSDKSWVIIELNLPN